MTISPVLYSQTFTNVAQSMGLNHTFTSGFNGGGVTFFDFNNDGSDDIIFSSSLGSYPDIERNDITHFTNVNQSYNILDYWESKTILCVDYDNDGDKDIFLCNFRGQNKLYKNTGSTYSDVTQQSGIMMNDSLPTTAALWLDYDRDGWLDVYVGVYSGFASNTLLPNRLYRNLHNGTFLDVTSSSNAGNIGNKVLALSVIDYNNDFWPDIYIASDRRVGNTMLKNNGNGTFKT